MPGGMQKIPGDKIFLGTEEGKKKKFGKKEPWNYLSRKRRNNTFARKKLNRLVFSAQITMK